MAHVSGPLCVQVLSQLCDPRAGTAKCQCMLFAQFFSFHLGANSEEASAETLRGACGSHHSAYVSITYGTSAQGVSEETSKAQRKLRSLEQLASESKDGKDTGERREQRCRRRGARRVRHNYESPLREGVIDACAAHACSALAAVWEARCSRMRSSRTYVITTSCSLR